MAFDPKAVNSITCRVAPMASNPKAGLSSLLLLMICKGACLSQRCVNLGFKACANGEINTEMSRLGVKYVYPH